MNYDCIYMQPISYKVKYLLDNGIIFLVTDQPNSEENLLQNAYIPYGSGFNQEINETCRKVFMKNK